jgi:hypothetical protein
MRFSRIVVAGLATGALLVGALTGCGGGSKSTTTAPARATQARVQTPAFVEYSVLDMTPEQLREVANQSSSLPDAVDPVSAVDLEDGDGVEIEYKYARDGDYQPYGQLLAVASALPGSVPSGYEIESLAAALAVGITDEGEVYRLYRDTGDGNYVYDPQRLATIAKVDYRDGNTFAVWALALSYGSSHYGHKRHVRKVKSSSVHYGPHRTLAPSLVRPRGTTGTTRAQAPRSSSAAGSNCHAAVALERHALLSTSRPKPRPKPAVNTGRSGSISSTRSTQTTRPSSGPTPTC